MLMILKFMTMITKMSTLRNTPIDLNLGHLSTARTMDTETKANMNEVAKTITLTAAQISNNKNARTTMMMICGDCTVAGTLPSVLCIYDGVMGVTRGQDGFVCCQGLGPSVPLEVIRR